MPLQAALGPLAFAVLLFFIRGRDLRLSKCTLVCMRAAGMYGMRFFY
jgi:hypothetical protein